MDVRRRRNGCQECDQAGHHEHEEEDGAERDLRCHYWRRIGIVQGRGQLQGREVG